MTCRVLVTGASGFIGRELTARLKGEGWSVNAAVRRGKGLRGEVVVGDIDAKTNWSEALQGCHMVIHLAARVHVMRDDSIDPLAEFRKVNVEGTLNLARQAAEAGVRRFVFLSSVKVNGESSRRGKPFLPDDLPAPEDAYGVSKLEAELALRRVCSEFGMEFVVIRPPLVYGPGVQGNFRSAIRWMKRGIPLPFAAISNQRSLIALDNLIDFIVTCLKHPAAANEVFLVSDGADVSTADMLRKISRAYGMPSRLVSVPMLWLRVGARMLGKAPMFDRLLGTLAIDDTKARKQLGWRPSVTMDEQLRKMALNDPHT